MDGLAIAASSQMGHLIQKTGNNLRFYAFNPLSWQRTGMTEIPYADTDPVHVIDLTTGVETPSQVVVISGERRLRILASNVPAMGYKVFEIRAGEGYPYEDAATVNGNIIENDMYRITLDGRGAITSLIDKNNSDRQFVRVINGRAMNDLGPGNGTVQVENSGPVSVTLMTTQSAH